MITKDVSGIFCTFTTRLYFVYTKYSTRKYAAYTNTLYVTLINKGRL